MFDDQIEIHSPGCLPNHQDIAKIKAVVSVARNPIIFTFATKEIPYRGIGSGIRRAIELYPYIKFVNNVDANEFVVIIKFEYAMCMYGVFKGAKCAGHIDESLFDSWSLCCLNDLLSDPVGYAFRTQG